MKNYQQLSIEEREKIHIMLWQNKSIRQIAFNLNRSPSTISRELKRNYPQERNVYTPRLAQERAKETIKQRGRRPRLKNEHIRNYVKEKLVKDNWSPEQISGTLPSEHSISHEAIYQYIYAQYTRNGYGHCIGEDLRIYLKRKHKVGLNTLVERVSGMLKVTKIYNGTGIETTRVVNSRLKRIPKATRKTLTVDNGSENAGHKDISKSLDIKVYFAHPYHSWERGCNENTNGLIRYYFPKGTDFATITDKQIREVEKKINNRPRKRLGYKTPQEVFNSCVALKR